MERASNGAGCSLQSWLIWIQIGFHTISAGSSRLGRNVAKATSCAKKFICASGFVPCMSGVGFACLLLLREEVKIILGAFNNGKIGKIKIGVLLDLLLQDSAPFHSGPRCI